MKSNRIMAFAMSTLMVALLVLPAVCLAADDDIAAHPSCPLCGMDRHKFAHSRVLVSFEDGSQFGACSLHCAALELAYHPDKAPVKIQVADLEGKQLIDAEKAVWVMGGNKPGVMTANAKWAFADEAGAKAFIAANGGKQADFETAISATYADMYQDTKMIREKRKKMKQMKMEQGGQGNMAHGGDNKAHGMKHE